VLGAVTSQTIRKARPLRKGGFRSTAPARFGALAAGRRKSHEYRFAIILIWGACQVGAP
jgi:hypothetical protein